MTTTNIPTVVANTTDASHFNNVEDGLTGDLYPRTAGAAVDKAGDLGSDTYPWLSAAVTNGHVPGGMMIPWLDYAGLVPLPQGFMLCDGSQINQASYEAQHAAGDWNSYVGSSPIEGLYLPNMNLKFMKGTSSHCQDGSVAITSGGNPGNVVNLAHSHGSPITSGAAGAAQTNISNGADHSYTDLNALSHTHVATILSALSAAQDITPQCFHVKFIMRILE